MKRYLYGSVSMLSLMISMPLSPLSQATWLMLYCKKMSEAADSMNG